MYKKRICPNEEGIERKERYEIMGTNMAYGVDLGWLSQLEERGIHWVDKEKKKWSR